jgi:elongation factor Ts
MELLRQRGAAIAEKRQGRVTGQGRVEAYVHHDGRLGALVEVGCETDFVARTPEFQQFCRELAMHVAAMNPEPKVEALLGQPFVKDAGMTVAQLLTALIAKTGEHCVIKRFTRFSLGEPATT